MPSNKLSLVICLTTDFPTCLVHSVHLFGWWWLIQVCGLILCSAGLTESNRVIGKQDDEQTNAREVESNNKKWNCNQDEKHIFCLNNVISHTHTHIHTQTSTDTQRHREVDYTHATTTHTCTQNQYCRQKPCVVIQCTPVPPTLLNSAAEQMYGLGLEILYLLDGENLNGAEKRISIQNSALHIRSKKISWNLSQNVNVTESFPVFPFRNEASAMFRQTLIFPLLLTLCKMRLISGQNWPLYLDRWYSKEGMKAASEIKGSDIDICAYAIWNSNAIKQQIFKWPQAFLLFCWIMLPRETAYTSG